MADDAAKKERVEKKRKERKESWEEKDMVEELESFKVWREEVDKHDK